MQSLMKETTYIPKLQFHDSRLYDNKWCVFTCWFVRNGNGRHHKGAWRCTFDAERAQVQAAAGVRMSGHKEEVFIDHKGGDIGSQLANTDQSKPLINIQRIASRTTI